MERLAYMCKAAHSYMPEFWVNLSCCWLANLCLDVVFVEGHLPGGEVTALGANHR